MRSAPVCQTFEKKRSNAPLCRQSGKKETWNWPTPLQKACGFACAFLAEIRPKKSPHTPVWGDFFNRFPLKNSLAKLLHTEKEQILCGAEARRCRHAAAWQDGATKESVQNLPFAAHVFLCGVGQDGSFFVQFRRRAKFPRKKWYHIKLRSNFPGPLRRTEIQRRLTS